LSKLAVTAALPFIVHAQVAVPLHAPPQPMKVEPEAGVAVSVTGLPTGIIALQLLPHEMPAGALVTVPAPVPAVVTESAAVGTAVPVPVSTRERVSPLATKLTLPAKVPAAVGWNRTVTTWLAPAASENEPPDTILYGAPTLAVPVMLAVLVFCTVKVASAELPTAMLPKLVVAVGVTLKSAWAAPLADAEHAPSFPAESTAEIRTKYVVPAARAVTRVETTCPAAGVLVDDAIVRNDALGQLGVAVPR
jgi:hypothetical protein